MNKITSAEPESKSADVAGGNLESLRALFPAAFTEGKIDFDVLRQLLGDDVDDKPEKYGLSWHGKRAARQLALTPSAGTLRPCVNESKEWDTTRNLMIEGDNLEVLKLLQKSYARRVKLIYIDPPYNTGRDFIYPDSFAEPIDTYLELTGQRGSDGVVLSSNVETSGRFHTDWLSMMSPRLSLAANLLTEDGFILISIDDAELANLLHLANDVLGEENHVATLVWDRNRKNDAKLFSVGHEYMIVYARSLAYLRDEGTILREPKAGIDEAREFYDGLLSQFGSDWDSIKREWRAYFQAMDSDDPRKQLGRFTKVGPAGPYRDDGDISWPGGGGATYEVLHPRTGKPVKRPRGGWVYSTPERFWEEAEKGRVVFGEDETTMPRQARYLFDSEGQVMRSVHYSYAQTATLDFVELMGARVFDNPKNWRDLTRMVRYLTGPDDVVLDFFAGSGSTAHAVMSQNSLDGGSRRFILVQLPEPIDEGQRSARAAIEMCDTVSAPRNIASITKERIRRAGNSIEEGAVEQVDTGFRVFKLDSSNISAWDPDRDDLDGSLLDSLEHIKEGRSGADILFELVVKLGLDLTVAIETREVSGAAVHSVGAGTLIACLVDKIGDDMVEGVALGIADWHRELDPAGETTVVFRDDAFASDVAKTNMTAILEQRGIASVRSL